MTEKIMDNGIAITFLGHACFSIASEDSIFLVDPWITGNPQSSDTVKGLKKPDAILITHAHGDHLGDAVSIARDTGATTISMPEIAQYLVRKGISESKAVGMNKGGTVVHREARITMVHAVHSSSIAEGDEIRYGGEAAGFVIRFKNGACVYHAGDTGVFSDMAIIGELYRPDVAMLPIGDHYVMGPEEAAYACKLLHPRLVIPMHFGTFPVLTGTPEKFQSLLTDMPQTRIVTMQPGETID